MSSQATPQSSASIVASVIDNGRISGQQVLVIALCMLFNMLDGFDITMMAIVAGDVAAELGLSDDKVGWIHSFALMGMMAGAMFLAPVSDVIGRRKMILLSIVIVGISIILTANATSMGQLLTLRLMSGIGAGAMLASQAALASEYSPDKYRALSVVSVTAGYPLGAMLTSVVAGEIMADYGWRGMFWFGGGVTMAMIVIAWFLIPESLKFLIERQPDGALERVNAILSKLKKGALDALPDMQRETSDEHGGIAVAFSQLFSPAHRKTTLTLWTAFLLSFTALYFVISWLPKLMVDSGFEVAVSRQAFFYLNLGGVIGTFVLGLMSTRWKLTNIIAVSLVLSAIGMAVFASVSDNVGVLLTVIFVVGFLQHGGFTGLYGVAAKVYPTNMRTTGIGWAIGLGRFGAVAGPAVAGYLIAAGLGMSGNFYFFAVPMALSGLIAYRLHVR